MIFYIVIILRQMASVGATVDCIEVRTQEKGFIRLTVEFDATAQGYTSNITTVNQILREVFIRLFWFLKHMRTTYHKDMILKASEVKIQFEDFV